MVIGALASVVIPAHNEASGIAATLERLHEGLDHELLDVVVVCNGCTDDTAHVVRSRFPGVRVVTIPQPSKADAVLVGNAATEVFPRIHLDADVRLSGTAVRALVAALAEPGVLAAGPERVLDRSRSSPLVRWYYDVWEQLPGVQRGLFGRGVFALSEAGQRRVSALPRMMSDDLAVSDAFAPDERRIVAGAESHVVAPGTVADLLRRRTRVATGNAQADSVNRRTSPDATNLRGLCRLAASRPRVAVRLPVFLGVAVASRLRARRAVRAGDFTTWLRDESSRA